MKFKLPFDVGASFVERLPILFVTSLLIRVAVCYVICVTGCTLSTEKRVGERERGTRFTRCQCVGLGRRIGPRFLFGSLGVLSYLVYSRGARETDTCARGLTKVCQCVVGDRSRVIIPLESRLIFIKLCVSLLGRQFPANFRIRVGIPRRCVKGFILSYSLRLLVRGTAGRGDMDRRGPLVVGVRTSRSHVEIAGGVVPGIAEIISSNLKRGCVGRACLSVANERVTVRGARARCDMALPLV